MPRSCERPRRLPPVARERRERSGEGGPHFSATPSSANRSLRSRLRMASPRSCERPAKDAPRSQRAPRALLAKGGRTPCDPGPPIARFARGSGWLRRVLASVLRRMPPVASERRERFSAKGGRTSCDAGREFPTSNCGTGGRALGSSREFPVESFGAEFAHELGCSTQPSDSSTSSRA